LNTPSQTGVSPREIFREISDLNWIHLASSPVCGQRNQVDLYGYLNPLRAHCVSVVDQTGLEWVYAQSENALKSSPALEPGKAKVLLLSRGCSANPALISVCRENNISLADTGLDGDEIADYLQAHLPRFTGLRGMRHGVFLAVMNVGVLITGASGVGKSEVAMDLVQRGHQLVADDAVEIYRGERGVLAGECPEQLRGYLEIRGLGIINVRKMFGPSSVLESYPLQLIIDLKDASNSEIRKLDRLEPSLTSQDILGANVPCLSMLVAPGRNLSVLVEAAVRNHLLRVSGVDTSKEFIEAHTQLLSREAEDDG